MKLEDKVASITGAVSGIGRDLPWGLRVRLRKMPPLLGMACHLIYGGKMNAAL